MKATLKVKATFLTSEICNQLNGRVPRQGIPQFRLQNFLLGNREWKTSTESSINIGEQGENTILRHALGTSRLQAIDESQTEIIAEYSKHPKSHFIFPTREAYRKFVRKVKEKLGDSIELEI